jgi:hypothetical protein
MTDSKLLQQISKKASNKEAIAAQVIKKPGLLSEIFAGLTAEQANIKYGCDKALRLISRQSPSLLYPHIDFFINNLESDNTFLKWGTIDIIANLAAVDTDNKIEKIFDKYFASIPGPILITAANLVKVAATIALAKPQLAARISQELLKVEKARYQNTECRNIAFGQVIESFDRFFKQIEYKEAIIGLVKRQLKNTRNATKNKAVKFLKKHT